MGDRRRTSLKLTKEAFSHLEEEQERRNLSTQQDTVEAIIRDNKQRRTSDADDEQEDTAETLGELVTGGLRAQSTMFAAVGIAVAALSGGSAVPLAVASVLIGGAVLGVTLRYRQFATDTAERDGDTSEVSTSSAPEVTDA